MSAIARGAARGTVAAMAMTGMRRMTTGLGLLEKPPPERMATEGVPGLFAHVPPNLREEAIELAHWAYGASAGAAFGMLPDAARRGRFAGPLYGVAIWAVFEVVVRRLFRLDEPRRKPVESAVLLADHVLYGVVVAARPRRV
jgi:hypothetical protein